MNRNTYYSLDAAKLSGCPMFSGTINYLEEFLGKPHPDLEKVGHKGSVCPFTPKVLENKTVHFVREIVDVKVGEEARTYLKFQLIRNHMQTFLAIEKASENVARKLACLVIVVFGPETLEECMYYVSEAQKQVQPLFVEFGLLLSELHPHSPVPSARNNEFFPSRPPFPIFFIRRLIANDIPYILRRDRYDEVTYSAMYDSLLRDFGAETINKEMERLGKKP